MQPFYFYFCVVFEEVDKPSQNSFKKSCEGKKKCKIFNHLIWHLSKLLFYMVHKRSLIISLSSLLFLFYSILFLLVVKNDLSSVVV